jgi:hypothetical protein
MRMKKHPLLATVAATALLAAVSIASAQRTDQPGGSQPGASEKSAPAQKSPGTTGQSPGEKSKDVRPETPKSGSAPKSGTTGQSPGEKKSEPKAADTPKSGTAPAEKKSEPKAADTPKSGTAPAEKKSEPKAADTPKSGTAPKSGTTVQTPEQKTAPAQKSTQPGTTTQPGSRTDATASLTVDQRTRIRETVLKSGNVPRVDRVDFQINVGTVVPRSVRVVALPAPVIEIHPAWRGYLYFVHGDEIVVVEPGTMRIVAVLPA